MNPNGKQLYASSFGKNTLVVVDIDTQKMIASIPVGIGPQGVGVKSDGSEVYVPNTKDDTLSIISTSNLAVKATAKTGKFPRGVDHDPVGHRIYVASTRSDSLTVLDDKTYEKVTEINGFLWPMAFGNFISK
jgi:YVTN family beta-propeller protein